MTTKDIYTAIDEIRDEIQVLENELIPELEEHLAYLLDPDYTPADNPDHEFREDDIDTETWDLRSLQGDLWALQQKLNELLCKRDKGLSAREDAAY